MFSNSLENAFDRLAFDFVLFRFFDGLFVSALVCKATVCRRRPNEIVGNQIRPVLYHCKPTQPFARWSYARRSSSDIKWSRSFLRSGGQKSIENLWISNVYRILLDSCEHMKVIVVSLDLPRCLFRALSGSCGRDVQCRSAGGVAWFKLPLVKTVHTCVYIQDVTF